jgi:DNA-binding XRE family transcriptional regulator
MGKTIIVHLKSTPNYKEIFKDMIAKKISKEGVSIDSFEFDKLKGSLDLIDIQDKILDTNSANCSKKDNKRLRTYNQKDIVKILKYKQKNNLSTSEVARKFNISRPTIFNWERKNVLGLIQNKQK